MPPLVAFGRKWEIGSDDLVYPSIRSLCVHVPWLYIMAQLAYHHRHYLDCEEALFPKIFLFGSLGVLSSMVLIDVLLIINSGRGSIMETHKRRYVPLFIYVKLFIYLAEIAGNGWATWTYTEGKFICTRSPETTGFILALIICNWIMVLFLFIFWIRQFDPHGTLKQYVQIGDLIPEEIKPPKTRRCGQWEGRLRCVFCCVCGEGRSKEIRQIYPSAARHFSYLFTAHDLVQSDYFAAVMLQSLRTKTERKQEVHRKYGGHAGFKVTSSINFDPISNSLKVPSSECWNTMPKILHYFDYAFAIFTIPAAFLKRRGKLAKSLCSNTQCCNCIPCRKKYPITVVNDNCCYGKTAAIRALIKDQDLIYASYDNSDFSCPFFVATDHLTKTIVIAIRGSFSAVDYLVDCNFTPSPMNLPGLPQEFKAHLGFLKVAKNIKDRLDEMGLLQNLTELYPDYMILTTGISLGAGVSSVLAMMFQAECSNVKCLAFAVPAGVSLDAAEFCDAFVTCVIYGDDNVPRMGIPAVARCLTKLEEALVASKTPKYKIQMGIGCAIFNLRAFRAKFRDNSSPKEEPAGVIPQSSTVSGKSASAMQMLDQTTTSSTVKELSDTELTTAQAQLIQDDKAYSPEQVRLQALEQYRLYPPGKILRITQTPAFAKCTKHGHDKGDQPPKWEIEWVDRREFYEIVFSKRMFLDHLPFRLARALRFFSKVHNAQFSNDVNTQPIE